MLLWVWDMGQGQPGHILLWTMESLRDFSLDWSSWEEGSDGSESHVEQIWAQIPESTLIRCVILGKFLNLSVF